MFTYSRCVSCSQLNKVSVERATGEEAICGKCKTALPLHGAVNTGDEPNFLSLVAGSPLPVIADFWAPWCAPCRGFAPIFEAAAVKFADRLVFAKLNTDIAPTASQRFTIRGIPTLILFKAGQEADRISGALPADAFAKWLESRIG